MGTEIELAFSLPGNPRPIKVIGKVVFVMTEDITSDSDLVPGMGIKFLNLKEDDKELLAACLENYWGHRSFDKPDTELKGDPADSLKSLRPRSSVG